MDKDSKTYIKGFFAHQPVLDEKGKVWGYELLYRHGAEAESALFSDAGRATLEVLANLALCPDKNFRAAKLVMSYSAEMILAGIPQGLPPERSVIKIVDPVGFDEVFLEKLIDLKSKGFSVLIRDFAARSANRDLYDAADILGIDVNSTPVKEQRRLLVRGMKKPFLAEKVETREQFDQAVSLGFSFFRGFFFERPKTNTVRKITAAESQKFKLLELLNDPDVDFDVLSRAIKHDVSLSLRLLSVLDSPAYGLTAPVTSIKQAAVYLGLERLKYWLRIVLLTDIQQPCLTRELTRSSLQRAKFLELLYGLTGKSGDSEQLFLLGLFSLLDAMLDMPMPEVVNFLSSLEEKLRLTLIGKDTEYRNWLQLVKSVERSDWILTGKSAAALEIETSNILNCYLAAREWSHSVLRASGSASVG